MYYHASQIENIKVLEPRISNHKRALIYFSKKRENVLVYLSNAVEKFCKENNFKWDGIWNKWASYCFDNNGIQVIEEYYPNALEETYKGISGYIYMINDDINLQIQSDIPYAYISEKNVEVENVEYINDAYLEILKAEELGLIKITRYEEFIQTKKDWLYKIINEEYNDANITLDYKYFLENKFFDIIKKS